MILYIVKFFVYFCIIDLFKLLLLQEDEEANIFMVGTLFYFQEYVFDVKHDERRALHLYQNQQLNGKIKYKVVEHWKQKFQNVVPKTDSPIYI